MTEANEVMTIQGQAVDSKNEFYVANALTKYGAEFSYQYVIAGGSEVRGGQIIDFMVWVAPEPIPLLVHGEYWHRDAQKEALRIAQIERLMHLTPVILWGDETDTPEEAEANVLQKVLRGVAL